MGTGSVTLTTLSVILLILFNATLSDVVGYFLGARKRVSTINAVMDSNCNFVYNTCVPVSRFNDNLRGILSFLPNACTADLLQGRTLTKIFHRVRDLSFPGRTVSTVGSDISYGICFFSGTISRDAVCVCLTTYITTLITVCTLVSTGGGKWTGTTLRPLDNEQLVAGAPLLGRDVFCQRNRGLYQFFVPFSLSRAFNGGDPSFRAIGLTRGGNTTRLLRHPYTRGATVLFNRRYFGYLGYRVGVCLTSGLVQDIR